MFHKYLRFGVVLVLLVAVLALVPAVLAQDNPCAGSELYVPGLVPTGSNFFVSWNPIPGAAGYFLTMTDDGGERLSVWAGNAVSWKIWSGDIKGNTATITVNAMTPESDVICSMGGTVGIVGHGREMPGQPYYLPPPAPDELQIDVVDEFYEVVSTFVVHMLPYGWHE